MYRGYLKLWRKIRDNPRMRDPDCLALWIWLLTEAKHKAVESMFGGKKIVLKPGQFTTGRKQLSELSGISESKIQRLLAVFESEHQIEQQTSSVNRLITIINWHEYQETEQQNEQQMNNKRTTNEQRMNTPKACKELKNDKHEENEEDPVSVETAPVEVIEDNKSLNGYATQEQITELFFEVFKQKTGTEAANITKGPGNYPKAFKSLSELHRPLADFKKVMNNGFDDKWHRDKMQPAYILQNFNPLLIPKPRTGNNGTKSSIDADKLDAYDRLG